MMGEAGPLAGFEVAGEDGEFAAADARIEGDSVVVRSAEVPRPVAARYAWRDDPPVSLFNDAGLPASPSGQTSALTAPGRGWPVAASGTRMATRG